MSLTYHIVSLGCQMNRSDSERIQSVLEEAGYSYIEDEAQADILGLVACSVRQKAIDRVYSRIHKWNSWKRNRNLLTFASGCILPADRMKLLERFDLLFDIGEVGELPSMIREYGVTTPGSLRRLSNASVDETAPTAHWDVRPSYSSSFEAFVPIQNGCDKFCTFCAVPYTRGREVSRNSKDIIAEVETLVSAGYQSITLLGQNVNSFGRDRPDSELSFADLLRAIGEIGQRHNDSFKLYFTSPHPRDMSTEVIETIAEFHCLAQQIHLPLQSGDDEVLKRMNRNYTYSDFLKIVEDIRRILPAATIFTDIIVGFSGETEAQFENTRRAMREIGFQMAYVAMYSPRPGARSADWPDDVPHEEKRRRLHALSEELNISGLNYTETLIGRTLPVLVESPDRKNVYFSGRSEGLLPVRIRGAAADLIGKVVPVRITATRPLSIEGELVEGLPFGWAGAEHYDS
ncbi:MAG: tRNA (N6-isopentenyl adenosine(37)-C2)-methylthiotransferase MiaB [Spirochaeta sp.]|nr:tRNA (N6-isopentenyl adenosine(37)-C2)-methylthiotransferase MiaB [Spirochaeta sp.]